MNRIGLTVGILFSAVLLFGVRTALAECHLPAQAKPYCVGAAKRDITPLSPVYLGGYGFGPVRLSTGVAHHIYARAIAINHGNKTVIFSAIDTQGHFLAYQRGPYGFAAIRRRVSTERNIPLKNIIIASIHDHAGPDDTGIWGGLSKRYLQSIADKTTAAIEDAIDAEKPAFLYFARTNVASNNLLINLLPPEYPLDTGLRTLVAVRGRDQGHGNKQQQHGHGHKYGHAYGEGRVIATLVNFSAHPTVLGSSNTLISPDWPGATIRAIEKTEPRSMAMVMVASVGRTQPNPTNTPGSDFKAAHTYGKKVAQLSLQSLDHAQPVSGPINVVQTTLEETIKNQTLLALNRAGKLGYDRILRSIQPPYLTGSSMQTVVGAVRIGDLLFSAVPAESYPETELVLRRRVAAQGHFLFGLAEDQWGYDPPAYEVPVVKNCSPNDEGTFIVNSRFGADITRSLLQDAQILGFPVTNTAYTGFSGGPQPPVLCNP